MRTELIVQPDIQLGAVMAELLGSEAHYERITLVSAFASLRAFLRLRELILLRRDAGCDVRIVVGIDLDGTSREVLQELLTWNCTAFVFQNAAPRSTFHPKVYAFQGAVTATFLIGSSNFTDGGLYTNHEATARLDFTLPDDAHALEAQKRALDSLLSHEGALMLPLTQGLIDVLVTRGQVLSESVIRKKRSKSIARVFTVEQDIPENPFRSLNVKLPPLLPESIRSADANAGIVAGESMSEATPAEVQTVVERTLVWRKRLPASDVLQVQEGTNPIGGVKLTQARFEVASGERIDQTTYFRNLFSDFCWERMSDGHSNQEHTFLPMRAVINGVDYGVRNFEVSHKPSGEAGQHNYTTKIHWGRDFGQIIRSLNLTGSVLSLYETNDEQAPFFMEISRD